MQLALLSLYGHVVWVTDSSAAYPPLDSLEAALLRQMSNPGRENTLAAYLKQGGQLWLVGGQRARPAPCRGTTFQTTRNPRLACPSSRAPHWAATYRASDRPLHVRLAHWRSGSILSRRRGPPSTARVGRGRPGRGRRTTPSCPPTGPEDDRERPHAPLRTMSNFFGAAAIHQVEYLSEPNLDPPGSRIRIPRSTTSPRCSTRCSWPGRDRSPFGPAALHPGLHDVLPRPDSGGMLFSGFDLWTFTRPDLITLPTSCSSRCGGCRATGAPEHLSPPPLAGRRRGL